MKSQKLGSRSAAVLVAAMAVSGTAIVEESQAAIIIDIQQVGADVVATFSGSWNDETPDNSTFVITANVKGGNDGNNYLDATSSFTGARLYFFGPSWGGSGTEGYWGLSDVDGTSATTTSVNHAFGVSSNGDGTGAISIANAYTFGAAITGTMTFAGATMASLGLDNYGTFVYSTKVGGSLGDSITVNLIGAPSAIPGAGLASVASVGLAGLARRRRR